MSYRVFREIKRKSFGANLYFPVNREREPSAKSAKLYTYALTLYVPGPHTSGRISFLVYNVGYFVFENKLLYGGDMI